MERATILRWPIRNQILLPFVVVLMVAVATTAAAAAYLAALRSEEQTVRQLEAVTHTLTQTNFPLTNSVLDKMRGLSGAHFMVRGEDGVVEGTLPGIEQVPAHLALRRGDGSRAFDLHQRLTVAGSRYIAAEIPLQGRKGMSSLVVLYPEQSWRQARWEAAKPPLAIGGAALAVMIVVAFWLAHRFSSRIRQLQQQVGSIAEGDFREIDLGSRDDELRELVVSVNRMSNQLRRMRETIRQTERTQLLGQLAGGLAHQLRNAITGARLAAQIHEKRCAVMRNDESLSVVLRQLAITEEQLKGILSLGSGEQRSRIDLELNPLLQEVALLVRPACEHARVAFQFEPRLNGERLRGDAGGLRAAVLNLTLNGIEAAGPNGAVALRAAAENGELHIEVSDTGLGPEPALADTVFEPFVTGKPNGVGLGLALASRVASEHGGKLTWQRREDMTCFSLRLPMLQSSESDPE
jgi:signal transduction histidine kinase